MSIRLSSSSPLPPTRLYTDCTKALLAAGTDSLGGARPKAAVLDEDGRQLIAKFPHHEDAWDVMAWEGTALDLAAAAGVRVARHRLVRVDRRHVLLLDRFDRDENDHRLGYVSAMTILEHRDGEHADYVDIADRLAEISARATDDAHQLFRRVAVSEAHGLIELARACRLSPTEARAVLTEVADGLGGWRDVASENGVPHAQLAHFEDSFTSGLRALREA